MQYLSNPARFGNTVMGSYAYLGEENLAALGAFLEASKGGESESDRRSAACLDLVDRPGYA